MKNGIQEIKRPCAILTMALIYYITARLSLPLAFPPGYASAFWPPSGLAVVGMMIYGKNIWPGIYLGSLMANVLTESDVSNSLMISGAIAAASTLQPMAIYYLLQKHTTCIPHLLNSIKNVASFLLVVGLCCTISSTLGVGALTLAEMVPHQAFLTQWSAWWLGDVMGIYVFTPAFFTWFKHSGERVLKGKYAEFALLLILFLIISILTFTEYYRPQNIFIYMYTPALIWMTYRFGSRSSTLVLVLISIIAVTGTALSYGPFVQPILSNSIVYLQLFIAVITITNLFFIAIINELTHIHKTSEEMNRYLDGLALNQNQKNRNYKILLWEMNTTLKTLSKNILDQNKNLELTLKDNQNLRNKIIIQDKKIERLIFFLRSSKDGQEEDW